MESKTKPELKQVNIQGLTYQYIDYNDDKHHNSVAGLIIPITPDVREKLLDVGGFYRSMLTPLSEDEAVHRIVILSNTERGMSKLIGFFFDNGQTLEATWTKEPKIVTYYKKHIKQKEIPYENINSLLFLQQASLELGSKIDDAYDKQYFDMLKHYYNPIVPNDTGIHNGDVMIHYGQTVTINNMQQIINKHDNLKQSSLGKLNVNKMELEIYADGPRLMGTIGSGKIYDTNGEAISSIKDFYYSYVVDDNDNIFETFEDYLIFKEIDNIHEIALLANRAIDRNTRDKQEIIDEYIATLENHRKESFEPVSQMIGLNLLLECIKANLVTV